MSRPRIDLSVVGPASAPPSSPRRQNYKVCQLYYISKSISRRWLVSCVAKIVWDFKTLFVMHIMIQKQFQYFRNPMCGVICGLCWKLSGLGAAINKCCSTCSKCCGACCDTPCCKPFSCCFLYFCTCLQIFFKCNWCCPCCGKEKYCLTCYACCEESSKSSDSIYPSELDQDSIHPNDVDQDCIPGDAVTARALVDGKDSKLSRHPSEGFATAVELSDAKENNEEINKQKQTNKDRCVCECSESCFYDKDATKTCIYFSFWSLFVIIVATLIIYYY